MYLVLLKIIEVIFSETLLVLEYIIASEMLP